MPKKRLVISDVHLGMPGYAEVDQLRTLWAGCDELIVNGDLAEVLHPRYAAQAGWMMVELRSLCEHDGVELTLISGNHDPYLADRRHLSLAGGQVFLTHGDVLHPSIAPWCPTSNQVKEEYFATEAVLASASRMDLETRLAITAHAAYTSWQLHVRGEQEIKSTSVKSLLTKPMHIVRLMHFWAIMPQLAARFAEQHAPEARFILTGHTHLPGVWQRRGRIIINTGCFTYPGKPRAVLIDGEQLSVHRIHKTDVGYTLEEQALKAFPLDPFDDEVDQEDDQHIPGPVRVPRSLNQRQRIDHAVGLALRLRDQLRVGPIVLIDPLVRFGFGVAAGDVACPHALKRSLDIHLQEPRQIEQVVQQSPGLFVDQQVLPLHDHQPRPRLNPHCVRDRLVQLTTINRHADRLVVRFLVA